MHLLKDNCGKENISKADSWRSVLLNTLELVGEATKEYCGIEFTLDKWIADLECTQTKTTVLNHTAYTVDMQINDIK